MTVVYNILTWIILLVFAPVMGAVALLSDKRRGVIRKRLGFQNITAGGRGTSRPVWIHALSVGEVTAAVPLVKKLAAALPGHPVYVSATTKTGLETARRLLHLNATAVFLFPFDFSFSINRIAKQVNPALVVIVESDIWPNFMRIMEKQGIPVMLANARLSDRTFRGYRRLSAIMLPALRRFFIICAQTDEDAERFYDLGLAPENVMTTGNMKFDQPLTPVSSTDRRKLKATLAIDEETKIIVAGSTHAGEEKIIAEAFAGIKMDAERTLLIIAPRDPARAEEVRTIFKNTGVEACTMTTRLKQAGTCRADTIVVDTIGLLKTLYAIADVAVIGGGFKKYRGHNPLEPAAYAKPILFGPHMDDFRQIAAMLVEAEGARQVNNAKELRIAVTDFLKNGLTAEKAGRAAFSVLTAHGGATDKIVSIIQEHIPRTVENKPASKTAAEPFTLLQPLLIPLSWLYGLGAAWRRKLYVKNILTPRRLPCRIVSVGNITTGGTGKTPLTIYLAALLKEMGLSPMIISRGYRGSASLRGGVVSDGRDILMDAGQSGDEPLLMAERLAGIPVVVGQNRYQTAAAAIQRFSPDVILLDDGFQHFQLARDIDIVLLDNASPLGNNRLLPAGPLREPPAAVRQADIVVFTRADIPGAPLPDKLNGYIHDKPRFNACHEPVITEWIATRESSSAPAMLPGIDSIARRRAYVFCGLANNQSFLNSVRRLTAEITGYRFFRDHHACTAGDLAAISLAAREKNADIIITSRKDYVKIRGRHAFNFPCDLVVLDAVISFKDQASRFHDLIRERLDVSA